MDDCDCCARRERHIYRPNQCKACEARMLARAPECVVGRDYITTLDATMQSLIEEERERDAMLGRPV